MAKKTNKTEWYSYAVLAIVVIVFISVIYAVTIITSKGQDIVYPQPNASSNGNSNTPIVQGKCGDSICQANERVGSIVYCGLDCY